MALNAQSDVGIELWKSATGITAWTKLIDVTAIPATGAPQAKIETTVLSSPVKQYIADREDLPDMEFTYNYTEANFTSALASCSTPTYFMIVYGDGSGAVIYGEANTWHDAVGRGQAVEAKLNIVPQSVEFKTITEVTALKAAV